MAMDTQTAYKRWHGKTTSGVDWDVHAGDAREILRCLPDESIDCIVTSPPYFWLRDYEVESQIGLEESVAEYIAAITSVMDEAYRLLSKTGVLFLNLGDTYYSGKGKSHGKDPKSSKRRFGLRAVDRSGGLDIGIQPKSMIGIPWRAAIEMTQRRWVLRSSIIWHRMHCLPEAVQDRPRRSYEHVFMFAKSRRYYFNREPLVSEDVEDMWTIAARPVPTNGISTAPFPDELVERCLAIGCPPNGRVLDPFAGSGTTLRVAVKRGCAAVGVDLNAKFCEYSATMLERL